MAELPWQQWRKAPSEGTAGKRPCRQDACSLQRPGWEFLQGRLLEAGAEPEELCTGAMERSLRVLLRRGLPSQRLKPEKRTAGTEPEELSAVS